MRSTSMFHLAVRSLVPALAVYSATACHSTQVAATGDQAIALTFEPITNSEHLYWNGLYQRESEWTRDGQTITVIPATRTVILRMGLTPRKLDYSPNALVAAVLALR